MKHRHEHRLNHNRAFMWGMMAMAFIVLMIAMLFLEWSFAPKA